MTSEERDRIKALEREVGELRQANEILRKGEAIVCVDARQAHAVLGQMHNKTDANDAAMLADLARTGFYRKVAVKSRHAQERRALLAAREAAIGARCNTENPIRGLLASFGLRLPTQPRTYEGDRDAGREL